MENTIKLLNEKEILESRIQQMIYGSIEIRKTKEKDIFMCILENNKLVKEYKKRLREIKKELDVLHYVSNELPNNVKINIDLAKRNLNKTIYYYMFSI